jgi:hypothetical protein
MGVVVPTGFPWDKYGADGGMQPKGPQIEGVVRIHRKAGWTALAWWDRSMDTRPNSCSAIVIDSPDVSYEAAMQLAHEAFSWVFERINFDMSVTHEAS